MKPSRGAPRVAVVGGGQLARMTYEAAIRLGVRVTVLDPDPSCPAVLAGAQFLPGTASRLADLEALASLGDVITFDHERVPIAHLGSLEAAGHRVAPAAAVFELACDKAVARCRLAVDGFPVPPARPARAGAEVQAFAAEHGWPVVVKAARGGYDGHGVAVVADLRSATDAARRLGPDLVVEELVPFDSELSVLVVRNARGEVACYDPASTVQHHGICTEVLAPASVPARVRHEAMDLARSLATTYGLVGVMAVELFLVGDALVVNELATRPHNSGHHTIEANETSQFEQHLRAVLDWPLGPTRLRSLAAAMCNILGAADGSDPRRRLRQALAVSGAHVHLYAKQPRPGRKLGHVTALGASPGEALAIARQAAAILSTPRAAAAGGTA